MGLWAPGKRGRLIQAGQVLGNMLKAHVAAYRALKVMPHGDTAQVIGMMCPRFMVALYRSGLALTGIAQLRLCFIIRLLLLLLLLLQIGIVHQHIRFIPHCNHLAALIVK
jgi:hypothetical protein